MSTVSQYFNITDIDQIKEILSSWDIEFSQLEKGKLNSNLVTLSNNHFNAFNVTFNKAVLQNGSSPRNMITFAIPHNNSTNFFWRGKCIKENNICVFPIDGDIDTESKSGFDVYGLLFEIETVERACEKLNFPNLFDTIRQTDVFEISNLSLAHLRSLMNNIFSQSENRMNILSSSKYINDMENHILYKVLVAIESHMNPHNPSVEKFRDEAFKKAKTFIIDNIDERLTIKNLVKEIGVTERTLERAFQERLNITPQSMIKSVKLNKVKKELTSVSFKKSIISDVANQWGFWHMGKFAKDYRQLFGELPSETVKFNLMK